MQIQRIVAVMTAITLLPFAGRCSKSREPQGATLQVDLTRSYSCEEFARQGMNDDLLGVVECGAISAHYDPKGTGTYYLYDSAAGTFTEFPKERKENPGYTGQLPDGRYIFLYNDAVGRKMAQDVHDGIHRSAEIFDKDLKLVESYSLPEEMPIGNLYENTITMDQDGNWVFFSNSYTDSYHYYSSEDIDDNWITGYYLLNSDFTVKKELDFGRNFGYIISGTSGTLYGIYNGGDTYGNQLYRLDCENGTAEYMENAVPGDADFFMTGYGDYELYYSTGNGIYGMRSDQTSVMIVDFQNSDLPDFVYDFYPLRDGSFIVNYRDDNANLSKPYLLKPRSAEEIANTKIISLAGVNINRTLLQEVCAFNKSQNEYRIVIKDYGKEWAETEAPPEVQETIRMAYQQWFNANVDYTQAVENFKNDLLDGTVPDIICMDDLPYQLLSNKGILTDLMPLLNEDERFDESLYLPNILNGLKRGDKLEQIGFAFTVDTIAAKTEIVGEKQGRTPDEYMEMLQNRPDGMEIFPLASREQLLEWYLIDSQRSFIDKGSMTCSFDSPAFIQLLELVNSLPSQDEGPSQGDKEYYERLEFGYNYADNHTLLCSMGIERPIQYHDTHYSTFRKADITLVGYPESAGGNGGMYEMDYTIALNSKSLYQTPVMDFILTELGKKRQSKICLEAWQHCSLPIMREPLENAILAATRGVHPNGNMNEQEMAVLKDYIENVRMYRDLDPTISAIIREEAGKYFALDCTAESAAKSIQGRVGLYLSEQG